MDDVQHRGGLVAEAGDLLGLSSSVCQSRQCPWWPEGRYPLRLELDKLSRIWADGFVETNDGSNVNDDFQISPCIWTASRLSTAALSRHQTAARPQTDGDKIFDHWPAAQANKLKQFSIFHFPFSIIHYYILHIPSIEPTNLRICTISSSSFSVFHGPRHT